MVEPAGGGLTPGEQAFCLNYFENRSPSLASIKAGYPEGVAKQSGQAILKRPRVKAYLKKLWEQAESPIVMMVRERKERLSQIGRGMVGDCLDESGQIDLEAIRNMPAVKEVTIDEYTVGTKDPVQHRTIKVKLLNPVESIAELNKMEKLYRTNEQQWPQNVTNNYYLTDGSVLEKIGRIGDRTQKQIATSPEPVERATEVKVVEQEESNANI